MHSNKPNKSGYNNTAQSLTMNIMSWLNKKRQVLHGEMVHCKTNTISHLILLQTVSNPCEIQFELFMKTLWTYLCRYGTRVH